MPILNCWEFKKCGREPGGAKVAEYGVCPVAVSEKYHGVNRGKNAGRICWLFSQTLCDIAAQGKRHKRQRKCSFECEFYKLVLQEEGEGFIYHI